MDDLISDQTTLVKFYQRLPNKPNNYERLFNLMGAQFVGGDVVIKQGTLIDASIVQSSLKPPQGHKVHIGSDLGSDITRKIEVTPANINDSRVYEERS